MKFTKKKIILLILLGSFLAFVAFDIINGIINPQPTIDETANRPIDQSIAEQRCQEEAIIKTQNRGIDVVSSGNYNPKFSISGDRATLTWSGKKKDSNKNPFFQCELSGDSSNPKIELLKVGTERLL